MPASCLKDGALVEGDTVVGLLGKSSLGLNDGAPVDDENKGLPVGSLEDEGVEVGSSISTRVGITVGRKLGFVVGAIVGRGVGFSVGGLPSLLEAQRKPTMKKEKFKRILLYFLSQV